MCPDPMVPEAGTAGNESSAEEVQATAGAPVSGDQVPAVVTPSGETGPTPDVTKNDRMLAGAAYATQVFLPILVPAIMLLSEENKKRAFQKYHAIQSLGFLVAAVIYEVLATIVFVGLSIVTLGYLSCVLWVLFLLPVVPAFYYAYQAYQEHYFDIPVVTEFLVQNKWLKAPA